MRASLAARVDGCWDRLEDVLSELAEVHEVSREEILARIDGLLNSP